jgi:hypothetical protein
MLLNINYPSIAPLQRTAMTNKYRIARTEGMKVDLYQVAARQGRFLLQRSARLLPRIGEIPVALLRAFQAAFLAADPGIVDTCQIARNRYLRAFIKSMIG